MCGIFGYTGHKPAKAIIIRGLKRLEYRGYDSAGIALHEGDHLSISRKAGKIRDLEEGIKRNHSSATCGIGHTRWATHGKPTRANAHPHRDCTGEICVIHNGIIENYQALKNELLKKGHRFASETDTEIIAHLLEASTKKEPYQKILEVMQQLEGYFAIAILFQGNPGEIYAARRGAPLVLGIGDGETLLASDYPPLLSHTQKVVLLEDDEIARLTPQGFNLWNIKAERLHRSPKTILWSPLQVEKGGYKHYMLKEIHEQPRAYRETLAHYLAEDHQSWILPGFDFLPEIQRVHIVACGTSWHAALIGKFYLEQCVGVPVEVDYASEYRYRSPIITPQTLVLGVSQSGETADTLAAMRLGKEKKAYLAAICNVMGSQVSRLADATLYTYAGPEIGVASTKAFTTQLLGFLILSLHWASLQGKNYPELLQGIQRLPLMMEKVLKCEALAKALARKYHRKEDFLYLGRHVNYPIALEGALKLKEISYIHAEGYPAGEMKHGPIALIDETMPVVVVATPDGVYQKVLANMEEVKARDGIIIGVIAQGDTKAQALCDEVFSVPSLPALLQPIINIIPLQLFAYHMALRRGCDVDQPRNLAKSVTVE